MKRHYRIAISALALAAALCCWAGIRSSQTPTTSLAADMPRGAMLYLEAKDFSALLHEWNVSAVKQAWLQSDNYKSFSLSRLALRLKRAQQEFAVAAGVPPDATFLSEVVGKDSALAIYDIGKLQFLYISRMPANGAMQSALWQARGKFESRSAAGADFFVHTDPQSGRVVAFAVAHGCLLLATREDLLAGALQLLAARNGSSIESEGWYEQAVAAAGTPGELRLVLNMDKVVATPYFRSYWIQRNVSAMRQYEAAISDFHVDGTLYREDRVLLRKPPSPSAAPETAVQDASIALADRQVAALLRLVPAHIGFYRAVANPGVTESLSLLKARILFPHTGPAPASTAAPTVALTGGIVGQESDLETRIDVPPPVFARGVHSWDPLRNLLETAGVQAALLLQSTAQDSETAFVQNHSAVVLSAAKDWDSGAVRETLTAAIRAEITTAGLGATWNQVGNSADPEFALDGLLPVSLAVRGMDLVISNDPATLSAVLAQMKDATTAEPATYAAGFDHRAEQQNFAHLTGALDFSLRNGFSYRAPFAGRPAFFSGNLASLSQVLSAVDSESVVVRESGNKTEQTIIYRWKQ